jgi:hypothetical protein
LDQLKNIPGGLIGPKMHEEVMKLLACCWPELKGAAGTSMTAEKLHRAEDLSWDPPVLTFTIERHGATVLGSTRAELQEWAIDLKRGTARVSSRGYRQLTSRTKSLDVKPIAAMVCDAVKGGRTSDSELVKSGILLWKGDNHVSVRHGALIPNEGFQQATAGRRRRFRHEVTQLMRQIGWELIALKQRMEFKKMSRDKA